MTADFQKGASIRVRVLRDQWVTGRVGYASTNGRRLVLEMNHTLGSIEGFRYGEGLGVLLLAVWSDNHWTDPLSGETLEIEKA